MVGQLDDLDETVVLVLGQRAGLGDQDAVADAGGLVLVMRADADADVERLLERDPLRRA